MTTCLSSTWASILQQKVRGFLTVSSIRSTFSSLSLKPEDDSRQLHLKEGFFPSFPCSHAGICSATTPFVLLGDVLDCLPLDQCDKIFSFVEENVSTWKSVNKWQLLGKFRPSIWCASLNCALPFFLELFLHCWEKLLVEDVQWWAKPFVLV